MLNTVVHTGSPSSCSIHSNGEDNQLFHKYLLRECSVKVTIPDAGNAEINKKNTNLCLQTVYLQVS